MRVLVANDEPLSRTDLVRFVEEQRDDVVGQARDGFEARAGPGTPVDVVLLDVNIVLLDSASDGGERLETLSSGVATPVEKEEGCM